MPTATEWYHHLTSTIGLWPTVGLIALGVVLVAVVARVLVNTAISQARRYVIASVLAAFGVGPTLGPTVIYPLILSALHL